MSSVRRIEGGQGLRKARAAWLLALTAGLLTGGPLLSPRTACAVRQQNRDTEYLQQLQRDRWNQLAPRNRRRRAAYLQAKAALAEGRHDEALRLIHSILNSAEDCFFWPERARRPVSLHRATEELLEHAPQEFYRLYLAQYGAVARGLLRRAIERDDIGTWQRLLRAHFLTPAAREAIRRLATRALDRGDVAAARRLVERVLDSAVHRQSMSPSERAAFQALLEAIQRATPVTAGGVGFGSPTAAPRPAGAAAAVGSPRIRQAAAPLQHPPGSREEIRPERADTRAGRFERRTYRMLGGSADRNGRFAATAPFPMPLWVRSLTAGNGVDALIAEWQQRADEDALALSATAVVPVTAGNQLIVRDAAGILSLEIHTGRPLWRYETAFSWLETFDAFNTIQSTVLVALRNAVIANPTFGSLATDGRFVYAVEFTGTEDTGEILQGRIITRDGQRREVPVLQYSNRLLAIALTLPALERGEHTGLQDLAQQLSRADVFEAKASAGEAVQRRAPVWTSDQLPKTDAEGFDSGRFYFLGPPLPAGDVLYVQAERAGLVHVLALRAQDGQLLWAQPIALSASPLARNPASRRHTFAATPALSGGLLLCPSGVGSITAVDPLTGVLEWIYDVRDEAHGGSMPRVRSSVSPSNHGFLPMAMVADDERLVYCSRDLTLIHCVALRDGTTLWTIPREDTLAVTGIDRARGSCILLGALQTRCVSLEDGQLRWSAQLGLPAGAGLLTDRHLILPLKGGRVATVELATGAAVSVVPWTVSPEETDVPAEHVPAYRRVRTDAWADAQLALPGHLIPHGALMASVRPAAIAVYPQAGELRHAVAAVDSATAARPAPSPGTWDDRIRNRELLLAELDDALGNTAASERRLDAWLQRIGSPQSDLYAAALKRELLYARLRRNPTNRGTVLEAIRQLAFTTAQKGRYLLERAEWLLEQRDVRGVVDTVDAFQRLGLRRPVTAFGNPHHFIAPKAWTSSVLSRLFEAASPAGRRQLQQLVTQQAAEIAEERQPEPLEAFVARFAGWPQAAAVRIRLAELYVGQSEFQKAEHHLLAAARQGDGVTSLLARIRLAELLDRAGLYQEAANLIDRLQRDHGHERLGDGRTVAEHLATLSFGPQTRRALAAGSGIPWSVETATIRQIPWQQHDMRFATVYGRYRKTYAVPSSWQLLAFDRGNDEQGKLVFVDRAEGYQVGEVTVPSRFVYPAWRRYPGGSHLIPLGTTNTMLAVSALEYDRRAPVWQVPFPRSNGSDAVLVGPAGATYCLFQSRQHLVAVDPIDGRILWQRRDLTPASGLHIDGYAGLIGDDRAVVLFESDRRTYTVYNTLDGRVLRRGELDIDARYSRRAFGRKLFYVTDSPVDRRMRIWDPLTNAFEFDAPFDGRMLTYITHRHELAVVLPNGQLHVIDVPANQTRLRLTIPPDRLRTLTYVRVFSDRDHYFVNLQHSGPVQRSRLFSSYATDMSLTAFPVHGALLCIDARSGRRLWERELPQRSVLDLSNQRLPFLVTMSSIRDTFRAYQRSLLVELIDLRTGHTILRDENLAPDRIAHVAADVQNGQLRINGFNSALHIDFSLRTQQLLHDPIVLARPVPP